MLHHRRIDTEVPHSRPPRPTPPNDDHLLDAYSRAVTGVVDAIGPAVIGLTGARGASGRAGSGSGVIVSANGLALTNSHVVDGRRDLVAATHDGDRIPATLLGDDPATDLALVKLDATDLPTATLGSSAELRPGQLGVALGSPFGLQSTVSAGVISALGRSLRGRDGRLIEGVVQHTAPLNPGNSGGPLLDTRGRVVGINTAIIAMAQGLGFAVPSDTARFVLAELLAHGRVRRPYLGVSAQPTRIPPRIAREADIVSDAGVEVAALDPDGPAARAGVAAGDVILALDGRLVASVDEVHRLLAAGDPTRAVRLTVLRDARTLEIEVRPGLGASA